MATTAIQIIALSLKDSGVTGEGITPSSETIQDSLQTLTDMLNLWEVGGLYTFANQQLPITCDGSSSYSVTGDVPYSVDYITYTLGTDVYPVTMLTYSEFMSISNRTLTGIPQYATYNLTQPNSELLVYPQPSNGMINLGVNITLAYGLTLTSDLVVPPAYIQAIRFNLAVLLSITFGTPIRQDITMIADRSLKILLRANVKCKPLQNILPIGTRTSFNIVSNIT